MIISLCGQASVLLLAASIGLVSAPAHAKDNDAGEGRVATAFRVTYRDLNLANPADVARLNKRIRKAARQACQNDGERGIEARSRAIACQKLALQNSSEAVHVAINEQAETRMVAETSPHNRTSR